MSFDEMTDAMRREWLEEQFEFAYCDECHGDTDDHECVPGPFGLPFAFCVKGHDACRVKGCDWEELDAQILDEP